MAVVACFLSVGRKEPQKQSDMKTLKTLFLVLVAGILLAGCTKEYIMPDVDTGLDMEMIDYDVRSGQWQLGDGYYFVTLDVPAITRQVVKYGNVQVSRCYPGSTADQDIWTPLPAMRVEVTEGSDGGDYFFTTYTDYEWFAGAVNIFVTTSDLYTEDRPGDMSFRVIITQ